MKTSILLVVLIIYCVSIIRSESGIPSEGYVNLSHSENCKFRTNESHKLLLLGTLEILLSNYSVNSMPTKKFYAQM